MISLIVLSERQNHRCAYCGIQLTFDTKTSRTSASRDHVIPRTRGGTNDESNLVAACYHCNTNKGSQDAIVFFKHVQALKKDPMETIRTLEHRIIRLKRRQKRRPSKDRRRMINQNKKQIKYIRYCTQL